MAGSPTVSFKNTVIVMNSNVGTGMVEKNTIGFSVHAKDGRNEDTRKRLLDALRPAVPPRVPHTGLTISLSSTR